MTSTLQIQILRIYVSPGHNLWGHHKQPPGQHETLEVKRVQCLARRGLNGDRICDFKPDYKGQVTFFAWEVYASLRRKCKVSNVPPSVFRRNIITRGFDLNEFIGKEFEIHGVRFSGTEQCSPCHWMNHAFHPEAEECLQVRGGLRARILTDGWLEVDE